MISDNIIRDAVVTAENRDLMKDSCTSIGDVMEIVNTLRSEEVEKMGKNPLAELPKLSYSTMRKVALRVAPVAVRNGAVGGLCLIQETPSPVRQFGQL